MIARVLVWTWDGMITHRCDLARRDARSWLQEHVELIYVVGLDHEVRRVLRVREPEADDLDWRRRLPEARRRATVPVRAVLRRDGRLDVDQHDRPPLVMPRRRRDPTAGRTRYPHNRLGHSRIPRADCSHADWSQ